ncbi:MAG: hypothetical protein CM1200mP16_02310 [Nitrospina sp.]|nr:MAG: hypothetical protein CM1200mP16_02310 [Nitrospina sp.]
MGDSHMGLQARLMSQAMRKLAGVINKSNTCLIFINQIRMKIGVMFGNPETTTGGNALKFYSSVRIDIRRIAALKDGEEVIGNRTRAKMVKNKVAPPFRNCEFDIIYGKGISKMGDLLDLGVANEIIVKSGTWFSYKENRIGQGEKTLNVFLEKTWKLPMKLKANCAKSWAFWDSLEAHQKKTLLSKMKLLPKLRRREKRLIGNMFDPVH